MKNVMFGPPRSALSGGSTFLVAALQHADSDKTKTDYTEETVIVYEGKERQKDKKERQVPPKWPPATCGC